MYGVYHIVDADLLLKDPTSFSVLILLLWEWDVPQSHPLVLFWKLFFFKYPTYQPHRGLCLHRRCFSLKKEILRAAVQLVAIA